MESSARVHLRKTRQRAAIRASLEQSGRPLSVAEILEMAKPEAQGLGIATVYRAVKSLLEEGWLEQVEIPGEPPRFEIAGKGHHHHFHCRACGRVFEIDACQGDFDRLAPSGFQVTDHEVLLFGKCADCAAGMGRPAMKAT